MNIKVMLSLLFILLATVAFADDESVTISGEVVDLQCYIGRGAKGEEHAGCANACISRDVPAGFLADDGTVYLLLAEKSVSVKEKVAGKAGKKLKVTGKVAERGGFKTLRVATIE